RRLHDVGGIVGREQPHPRAPLAGRRLEDQLRLVAGWQRQQQVLCVGVGQEPEPLQTLLGGEHRPRVQQLRDAEGPLARLGGGGRRHGPPLAGQGTLASSSPPGAGGVFRAPGRSYGSDGRLWPSLLMDRLWLAQPREFVQPQLIWGPVQCSPASRAPYKHPRGVRRAPQMETRAASAARSSAPSGAGLLSLGPPEENGGGEVEAEAA